MIMASLIQDIRAALANPETVAKAREAFAMVKQWSDSVTRLPGCGTVERLAVRIHHGMTIEQAAAREYAYRWHLPLNQWVNHAECRARSKPVTGAWPVPHLIGL